jgi:hypothetical protein
LAHFTQNPEPTSATSFPSSEAQILVELKAERCEVTCAHMATHIAPALGARYWLTLHTLSLARNHIKVMGILFDILSNLPFTAF